MTVARPAMGAFLRSRRDALSPAQAGIRAFPGARRVPGLRREELAVLAGLSPDYYSRLEQGRQGSVSTEVLDSLARALRLTEVEHAHLRDLASPPRPRRPGSVRNVQRADPGLLRLIGALDHLPVLLLGRRGDVLADNLLLRAVLGSSPAPGSSFPRWMFTDPAARERIVNWEVFASRSIAALRREIGRYPDDRRLLALVDELRRTDADASRWWDDHGVRDLTSVAKLIDHPVAGRLAFDIEIVASPGEPDQQLVVYTVENDSTTHRRLPHLASWGDDSRLPDPGTTSPRR